MHFKLQEYIKFFFISFICFPCVEYLIKPREVKIDFYLEIRKALNILNRELNDDYRSKIRVIHVR